MLQLVQERSYDVPIIPYIPSKYFRVLFDDAIFAILYYSYGLMNKMTKTPDQQFDTLTIHGGHDDDHYAHQSIDVSTTNRRVSVFYPESRALS